MANYAKLYYSTRTSELALVEQFFEWQLKTCYVEADAQAAFTKSKGRSPWAGELIHAIDDKETVLFTFYTFQQLYDFWNEKGLFLL